MADGANPGQGDSVEKVPCQWGLLTVAATVTVNSEQSFPSIFLGGCKTRKSSVKGGHVLVSRDSGSWRFVDG